MEQNLALPSLPVTIVKFLETSLDDSCDINTLADLARTDPSLSANILRLANSPYFSKGRSVSSLKQAAIVLGLKLLQNIALTLSIYESFSDLSNLPNFSLGAFWYHSLSAAASAKRLAEKTGFEEPEEAFIAGLLHDIGQLVLIRKDPKGYQQIFQLACTGHTVIEAELEIWGRDHAEVGAELLKEWRLQPFICDAVRYHHHSLSSVRTSLPLTRIIYLADILSHSVQSACGVDLNYLAQLGQDLLAINRDELEGIREAIESDVEELSSILGFQVEKGAGDAFLEVIPVEEENRETLREKARLYSLLVGSLQNLLSASDEVQLTEVFIQSLLLFFDVKSALFLKRTGNTLLGEVAVGTKDDSICSRIRLSLGNGTLWDSCLENRRPIFSQDYFKDKEHKKIIEKQILSYVGEPLLALPVSAEGEVLGCVFIHKGSKSEVLKRDIDLLTMLSKQFAHAMRTFALKGQLKKEQTINEAILKHATTGFLLTKDSGEILFLNPVAKTLLSMARPGHRGKGELVWDLLGMDKKGREEIADALSKDRSYRFVWHGMTSQGEKWIEIAVEPISVDGLKRLLLALHDVTSKKLLEKERENHETRLREELEKKTRELRDAHDKLLQFERLSATTDFARRVVHEVNNPLGVIKNYLRLLKFEKEKGEIDIEALDTIDREIDRITSILNQLRSFAKGETETNLNRDLNPGSIEKAVEDVARLMKKDLEESGITFNSKIEVNLPLVKLSEDGIKQVLINMIKNAQEAFKGKGGQITIEAKYDTEKSAVVLTVKDSGPGVDPSIRDKIFDPYVSTKGGLNSGLGLSVCYGLVKSVGGNIDLGAEDGGTTFIITLPVSNS